MAATAAGGFVVFIICICSLACIIYYKRKRSSGYKPLKNEVQLAGWHAILLQKQATIVGMNVNNNNNNLHQQGMCINEDSGLQCDSMPVKESSKEDEIDGDVEDPWPAVGGADHSSQKELVWSVNKQMDIGEVQIIAKIGRGSYGDVFKGNDTTNRIKKPLSNDQPSLFPFFKRIVEWSRSCGEEITCSCSSIRRRPCFL